MKIRTSLIPLLLTLFLLCACEPKENKRPATGAAQSAPYELLVVANKEWLPTPAGKALMDVVEAPVEGLPQYEPCFRCTKINPAAFNATFKMYGNIVIAETGSKHQEAGMRISRDVYCRPQLIVFLTAPDDQAFMTLMEKRREQIICLFNEQELSRERRQLARKHSGKVKQQAEKQFGVSILAPADIDQVKVGRQFFWASAGKQEFRLNICIYTLPLGDLTQEQFVAARDSVMKQNIPGGHDGQWMETDDRTVTVKLQPATDGKPARMEVRGLWDMRHDAMGGPFVSHSRVDTETNRVIVVEGFVYAPEKMKRGLIRRLEGSLYTLQLPEEQYLMELETGVDEEENQKKENENKQNKSK